MDNEIRKDDDKLKLHAMSVYSKVVVDLVNKLLQMFLKRSQAKTVLLIHKDGHLITTQGDTQSLDMDSLCTLLAGTFAATKAWAKLLGEDEFSVLFHQGKRDSIQVTLVGDRTLLVVIFDERTQLGLVRLMSNEAAKKLEEIFEQEALRRPGEGEEGEIILGKEFRDTAQNLLDNLFGKEGTP